jgi:hypothetical protein
MNAAKFTVVDKYLNVLWSLAVLYVRVHVYVGQGHKPGLETYVKLRRFRGRVLLHEFALRGDFLPIGVNTDPWE